MALPPAQPPATHKMASNFSSPAAVSTAANTCGKTRHVGQKTRDGQKTKDTQDTQDGQDTQVGVHRASKVDSTIRRTVRFEPPQTLIFILKSQNGWRYLPLYHSCSAWFIGDHDLSKKLGINRFSDGYFTLFPRF